MNEQATIAAGTSASHPVCSSGIEIIPLDAHQPVVEAINNPANNDPKNNELTNSKLSNNMTRTQFNVMCVGLMSLPLFFALLLLADRIWGH